MIFDYLTGRNDDRLSDADKKALMEKYGNVCVDKLRDWIFEGVEKEEISKDKDDKEKIKKHYLSIYKRDIFFDAVIKKPYEKINRNGGVNYRILESDSITPHGDNPLKNPIPIPFVKIAPGVIMEFRFNVKDYKVGDKVIVSSEMKRKLFKQILLDFGIGAKTNVGYGQFSNGDNSRL